ncbi:hypothetical protein KOI35_26255 [Actinoplanes bogorensis]|uniref:Uncharacterized protein n=1 Tax=Paractinoplanes bogorensis TaxID=1610840 RepID=A0ABS5YY36_9ACTN|nr:hypothetical protein [Actinoplanes bogorensis]MBU2667020.1 hypothetical protein [Actinoplanes bogorensis]
MSDPLTPLFDDLRRRTLPQVQPPGTEAARRTVHRRVTVQAATLAAVVMVAGGSYIVAQRDATPYTMEVVASASPSTDLWRGRADKAEIAAALVPGFTHSDIMGEFPQDVGMAADAGRYRLRVGCSGPAPLPLTIMINGTVDRQETIVCTDAGSAREFELNVLSGGSVRVIFGNQGQFAAYALKLSRI